MITYVSKENNLAPGDKIGISGVLKGYCTVFSLLPEILVINRYL